MSHRLTVTLLAAALLAACQSSPTAQHAPEAEAATAAADAQLTHQAAAAARSEQATLDSIVVTGSRLHREQQRLGDGGVAQRLGVRVPQPLADRPAQPGQQRRRALGGDGADAL